MSSEPIWYYADGEHQRGPVTVADLKRLIDIGRVRPTDLVWHSGMEDWVPAKSLSQFGIADRTAPIDGDVSGESASDVDDEMPFDRIRRTRRTWNLNPELLDQWGTRYGRLLVLAGLLLMILGRGCDSIGQSYAKRQQALLDLARDEFETKYDRLARPLDAEMAELSAAGGLNADQQSRLIQLRDEQIRVSRQRATEQAKLTSGSWLEMEHAARSGTGNYAAWKPAYEVLIWAGTALLACGALSVGFIGHPIERAGSWVLLAILAVSLLIWTGW